LRREALLPLPLEFRECFRVLVLIDAHREDLERNGDGEPAHDRNQRNRVLADVFRRQGQEVVRRQRVKGRQKVFKLKLGTEHRQV